MISVAQEAESGNLPEEGKDGWKKNKGHISSI